MPSTATTNDDPCLECEALDAALEQAALAVEAKAQDCLLGVWGVSTVCNIAGAACAACIAVPSLLTCGACAAAVVTALIAIYKEAQCIDDAIEQTEEVLAQKEEADACWEECICALYDTGESDTGDTGGDTADTGSTREEPSVDLDDLLAQLEDAKAELEDLESEMDDYEAEAEGYDEDDYEDADTGWEEE